MSIQKKDNISKLQTRTLEQGRGKVRSKNEELHTTILIILIITFTGLAGFALGKLDGTKSNEKSFVVETIAPELMSGSAINSIPRSNAPNSDSEREGVGGEGALVVGSKNSTKYHFPWCSGAKRINPDNLVSFSSFEAARNAGYTPAANCPGLE